MDGRGAVIVGGPTARSRQKPNGTRRGIGERHANRTHGNRTHGARGYYERCEPETLTRISIGFSGSVDVAGVSFFKIPFRVARRPRWHSDTAFPTIFWSAKTGPVNGRKRPALSRPIPTLLVGNSVNSRRSLLPLPPPPDYGIPCLCRDPPPRFQGTRDVHVHETIFHVNVRFPFPSTWDSGKSIFEFVRGNSYKNRFRRVRYRKSAPLHLCTRIIVSSMQPVRNGFRRFQTN